MSDISGFEDYRDFIQFQFQTLKKSKPKFSYQNVANDLGTTKSYLKLVIDKKRHISLDKLIGLADYFKLSSFETQYLIFSFLAATSKETEIKEFFKSILSSYLALSRSPNLPNINLDSPAYNSINHNWIRMAILNLSQRPDFTLDTNWIHMKLGGDPILTLEDIKDTLQFLLDKKFLIQTENGYKATTQDFTANPAPYDLDDFKKSILSGLKRTQIAIEHKGKSSLHRPNRHFNFGLTLSHEEVDEVMKLTNEFHDKLLQISRNSKSHDRVVFVSSHAFAISVNE